MGLESGIALSSAVGCRCGSDLLWLWLWLWLWPRPAAVAPIQPLAWETPNATGMALKRIKKKNPYVQYNGIWTWSLGMCLDHEGETIMNGIRTLMKAPLKLPCSFYVRILQEV